jgi:hypothetical protein
VKKLPTSANNRVCDAQISLCDVGVAPCSCSIIEIRVSESG